MEIEYYKLSDIKPYFNNPRKNEEAILGVAESIQAFGFRQPITVDKENVIITGHTRWKAALKLGLVDVPVIKITDLDPVKIKAYRIADNKHTEKAEWDFPLLKDELQNLDTGDFDLEITGFSMDEIEEMMTKYGDEFEGNTDDDAVPEEVETRCKTGDLWQLGKHRLLCGDATKKEDVERLMDGKKADMVFTDPPYGVDYVGKTKDALKIKNDKNENIFASAISKFIVKNGGSVYVCSPPGNNFIDFEIPFREYCYHSSTIIWVKDCMVLGHGDYHFRHEPILYGWQKEGTHKFYGDRTNTTVWEIARPKRSEKHPTMKPVELVIKAISNSSLNNHIVYDCFLGSGSTLIACEKTNRICYGLEIDEHYCDVIIQRWEEYTDGKAEKSN